MAWLKGMLAGVAMMTALVGTQATAEEVELPDRMTWTNYNSQSLMFAQSVAIGEILENKYGMKLTVMPVNSGFARTVALNGRADMILNGTDGYFAQEGAFAFARPGAGPMKVRLVLYNEIEPGNGVLAAGDAGIETAADIKGKRVAFLQGSPSSNKVVEATLAFAGLTWDDVTKIPVSSFSDAHDAIINGQADVASGNMIAASVERVASSPRGIQWIATPHDDAEGWARLNDVAPYIQKQVVDKGIGLEEGAGLQFNGYGYPEWLTKPDYDADAIYNLVKAIDLNFEEIVRSAPQSDGYALDKQRLQNQWPWHEGAIRYFKEKGLWNDEAQAHQDKLVERQDVLAKAWEEFTAGDAPSDEEAFAKAWGEARAAALEAADMPVVYRDVSGG